MLSLVISGRNDNHNGDFDLRAEYAVRHNNALLRQLGINHEIVWVEWNPLPSAPVFAKKLLSWCRNARAFIVPQEVHNHLCDNPSIGVMQFHAKNTGIRRAIGKWILSMNADTYLTEEVLSVLSRNNLDPSVFYVATRLDFDSAHLQNKPENYPVKDLSSRKVTLVSKIDIPRTFGSVGDFSLLHRDQWMRLQGHFEGIRFSNHHMDTLLCRQWMHLGGSFRELGYIYHADHKDSWNNFAMGDDKKHHGGCNYDCNKITIPYNNPENWGLLNFNGNPENNIITLSPPPDLTIRSTPVQELIIPEELSLLVKFTGSFLAAVEELKNSGARVVIYGLGDQVRQAVSGNQMSGLNIIGFIDDSPKTTSGLPFPQISAKQAAKLHPDAVLIGSMFWADQLQEKASFWIDKNRIFPRIIKTPPR